MTFEQKDFFQSLNNNPRSFLILACFTIILALIAIPPLAHTAEVTLAWYSSEGAAGYNLYCGLEAETYDDIIDVGNNLQHTLTHLSENQLYYCALTAYNEYGESGYSDEISFKTTADGGTDNVALEISNLTNASGAAYEIVEGLADGAACYIDRSYTYSNIPDFLQGATYIKTANSDKRIMADPLISFDINSSATVYVAFDNRYSIPDWMSDFTDTGYDLRTDVSFSIYAKDFPAARVYLGPNGHGGSIYTVIIVGDSTGDSGNGPPPVDSGNQAPTADAGDHQTVDEGDTVLLDGSYSSDPDDGIKTYQWEQIEGTPVELSDSNAIEPSFICPAVGANGDTLTFRLTVTDYNGVAASDKVKVFVNDFNAPPPDDTGNEEGEATTVEIRVATGSDDAEEGKYERMHLSSRDLELGYNGIIKQTVGIRFSGVAIPQNAKIVNAYVQFQVDEKDSEATALTIKGEAIDDAPEFTSTRYNISSRIRTSAHVPWSPRAWTTVGEAGSDQRTPDISQIVQEIVDQPGWLSGNSLALIITGTGQRVAESYNGDQSGAPLLHVEYIRPHDTGNDPPLR